MRTGQLGSHHWAKVIGGVAVTLGLLAWVLRDVSFQAGWASLQGAQGEWLGLGLIAYLASFSLRARRWGTLLGAHCDPGSFEIRNSAVFIGFAGNCVFPANAGEIVRVAVLHRLSGVQFEAALGSILAERLLDLVAASVFLLASGIPAAVFQSGHGEPSAIAVIYIGTPLAAIYGLFFVAARWPNSITWPIERLGRALGLDQWAVRIVGRLRLVLNGLGALSHPSRSLTAMLETFFIWGLLTLAFWCGMIAFGITSPGLSGALYVQSLTAFAIALPSTPGYFGPFEAAVRFALEAYAIQPDVIAAYALTLHLLMYVSLVATGFAVAWSIGLLRNGSIRGDVSQWGLLAGSARNPKAVPSVAVPSDEGQRWQGRNDTACPLSITGKSTGVTVCSREGPSDQPGGRAL